METRLEDLRKWFGKGKKGDWVRVGTDGEIKGDCAREPGEGKPKCMPRSKAHSMDKKDRAASARRKRRKDPMADRPGTGNKPIMVKTDKKESVVYENVNMKNVDKLKVAARDFGKNRDINSKSIEDALLTIVQSMRVLDKSTSGRADYKHEKIIDKQIVRINNIINKTNYGKTGQSEEGKEIVKILNKHKLNGPRGFHKVVYEGVEMNESSKVPAGMKFIASYVYKDANGKDHTHRHLRKGTKMTDPVVVYIDDKEWKTFQSFTKAKQAAISHIKGIKESVEMNEQFVVKYAKNKRGPIYQTKFSTQGEAEKFLAQKRKEGMNGIISKAGKPVSMQKMKDLQKESIEEATFMITVRKAGPGGKDLNMKVDGKDRNDAVAKWRKAHPKYKNDTVDVKPLAVLKKKGGKYAMSYESVDLEEKNVPTNPALWAKFKAQAKAKFDVYPSAYANGWAAKKYKAAGGSWKSESVDQNAPKSFEELRDILAGKRDQ